MTSKQIWKLDSGRLVWDVTGAHSDNYEMSGTYCDTIVDYGVAEDGSLQLEWACYFPTLRTIPNDTHATLEVRANQSSWDLGLTEYPVRFILDGTLTVESRTEIGVLVRRQFFPASDSRCALQRVTLTTETAAELTVLQPATVILDSTMGTKGTYISRICHTAQEMICLLPGETAHYTVYLSAEPAHVRPILPDASTELKKRQERTKALCDDTLVLDTGMEELDVFFRFAKLRAGESIFETLTGKYHSPGGRKYYAAVWCNDQVEYAAPHFAMTGDKNAIEASLNACRAYVPFMAEDYAPIPSSVIAEGLDIWNGAGDRGDAAMYLYGASLFALYLGDEKIARELYGPIRWCAEYCERKKSPEGVICSDTDELERRIPTDGYANLSTSCLCYGGLMTAAKLAEALEDGNTAEIYRGRAKELKKAIEEYFGAQLHGYHAYRYSKGFDTLRAWICLPLCVGIMDRAEGTVDAMLSDYLWTEEGMLSCEISPENQDRTIWDRSTLYGFKAAFAAGQGERVVEKLRRYCRKRLLCDRVPYPVEAYPEGEKRHLSAESALFVRVITEGLLGIQPERLDSFSFVPSLPEKMPHLYLNDLRLCGHKWDIRVEADRWKVYRDGALASFGITDAKRVTIK